MTDLMCVCGHPQVSHHLTRTKRWTWCSVWDTRPERRSNAYGCPCKQFTLDNDGTLLEDSDG